MKTHARQEMLRESQDAMKIVMHKYRAQASELRTHTQHDQGVAELRACLEAEKVSEDPGLPSTGMHS